MSVFGSEKIGISNIQPTFLSFEFAGKPYSDQNDALQDYECMRWGISKVGRMPYSYEVRNFFRNTGWGPLSTHEYGFIPTNDHAPDLDSQYFSSPIVGSYPFVQEDWYQVFATSIYPSWTYNEYQNGNVLIVKNSSSILRANGLNVVVLAPSGRTVKTMTYLTDRNASGHSRLGRYILSGVVPSAS